MAGGGLLLLAELSVAAFVLLRQRGFRRRSECQLAKCIWMATDLMYRACSSGGSSAALSPAAASEAAGEGLIRAVRSLRDVTALHSSIEVGLQCSHTPQ